MDTQMTNIKRALLSVVMFLGAAATVACSSGDDGAGSASEPAGQATGGLSVPAGDETRELGIELWRLSEDGIIEGLSKSDDVVARFKSHTEQKAIESLSPKGGLKLLDGSSDADTFSQSDRQFYEALLRDMREFTPPSAAAEEQDGLGRVQQPVWYGPLACCYGNKAGQYYYWVDAGGYTPYCHVDVFTYSCSGLTSCFAYGNATGCLYWI
jgi:hypothetical protein